ncbi:MAG: GTP-binding protein [Ruminococcaceae bacterium]|nr:GTP-binding protein [Oscillospiraceae bacterium]
MKRLVIGMLAHVDAGKTTLSEALLYSSGNIRKIGRVDHGDAFLDNFLLERERGITIFSKQAMLKIGDDCEFTLLDTPGHVDFSSEAERTLRVLDYAVLVISASEGIQSHTSTIWQLLARYRIPTFIFINKTDLPCPIKEVTMRALRERFGDGCIDFTEGRGEELAEEIAMRDEELLDSFISSSLDSEVLESTTAELISHRKIFPCLFGSALKLKGVDELIALLEKYTVSKKYSDRFAAKVYKISRDEDGTRLTHMKITGGELKTKDVITTGGGKEEKIERIRIYSGAKFTAVDKVVAGQVCAVCGPNETYGGEGLGSEPEALSALLEPVLTYRIVPLEDCIMPELYEFVKKLEEEDPALSADWNERLGEIHVRVMGEVQLEVLERVILDRFGIKVAFDEGNIVYKETIAEPVFGVGHFEPLRHYAEVHLLLEPTGEGSGLSFDTLCSENQLEKNWQRLVMTHLSERMHLGVLTGSPITDMRISLVAGRAHKKHTEGGDFRQATYRAVRQGLMRAKSVLLEPYYSFSLTVPQENIGRAISDVGLMNGSFTPPESSEDGALMSISGYAPVSAMRSYAKDVSAYTRGRGRLVLNFGGYKECKEPDKVISAIGYDPERDPENTADSVFCAHGAGFVCKWNEAEGMMHVENFYRKGQPTEEEWEENAVASAKKRSSLSYEENVLMDKELATIFERTYGPIKKRALPPERTVHDYDKKKSPKTSKPKPVLPEYLLVDGYNIIFAWDDLKKVAEDNLNLARQLLINILCNYQGYRDIGVILVFDAYKVTGGRGSVEKQGGIHVVYTKEAETADAYIERVSLEMAKKYRVRVATSDNLEQMIVLGHGAERVPARIFYEEVCEVRRAIDAEIEELNNKNK